MNNTTKTITLIKANSLNKYTLTLDQFEDKFIAWMTEKEKSWLEYYCIDLVKHFIEDGTGLYSAIDEYSYWSSPLANDDAYERLNAELKGTKWKYLNERDIY